MKFEEAYAKLEKIKQELENPELSFDEAVSLYKESEKLVKTCFDILADLEGQITIIKSNIDGFIEKPLEIKED